jgi:drug/metabolite transporter (DMT)-like permease
MESVGPFTFNAIRFALGSVSLVPIILLMRKNGASSGARIAEPTDGRKMALGGAVTGLALFMGATLQQVGLVYTTAGKAGFITGLYVVIVPLIGLFWGQRPNRGTWAGACMGAAGLYLLSVTEDFTISFGDLLVLIGAFFWACHVLVIGWLSPRMDPIVLSFLQFAACSLFSLIAAVATETTTVRAVADATVPILYGGLVSVGVAYTLQVVAQRDAHPAHAAVLLSMEAVFAALGGWLILNETLPVRGLWGCGLMLSGMLLSQLSEYLFHQKQAKTYSIDPEAAHRQTVV